MTDLNMKVRSTPPEGMSPNEKLFTAISIVQAYILAEDSNCIPNKMFGNNHFKQPSLEMVERLLMDIVPDIEDRATDSPVAANPETPSRILELFREHLEIGREATDYDVPDGVNETQLLEVLFWERRDRLEEEMMSLPAVSAADFAAKLIVDSVNGSLFSDWDNGKLWREARALVGIERGVA